VLKDLPKKTERIEWCEMTDLQRNIYTDALQRSRKTVLEAESTTAATSEVQRPNKKSKQLKKNNLRTKEKKQYLENSSNVLMDLRKAASHPMLFRTHYTDQLLTNITKQLMKEADFKKRNAKFDFVKEDMEVMTDSELQMFCAMYKVGHHSKLSVVTL
jgi:SWI/SNF-related matrix-associated actin-dependent regulator of chromatin subfamily A containing DEAD/H box 1